jgi:hypothetical protein
MPGTKHHEYEDMVAFAGWRADYLKVDWCNRDEKLTGTITVKSKGSDELPLWKVRPGLPSWLSMAVTRNGKS